MQADLAGTQGTVGGKEPRDNHLSSDSGSGGCDLTYRFRKLPTKVGTAALDVQVWITHVQYILSLEIDNRFFWLSLAQSRRTKRLPRHGLNIEPTNVFAGRIDVGDLLCTV